MFFYGKDQEQKWSVLLVKLEWLVRNPVSAIHFSAYEELEKQKLGTLTSTFLAKKLPRKVEKLKFFDLTIVKNLSTFRPKKAKVEKLKSRKVEKLKSWKVEKSKSWKVEKWKLAD